VVFSFEIPFDDLRGNSVALRSLFGWIGRCDFLSEIISLRLLSATVLSFGGISLIIVGKEKKN